MRWARYVEGIRNVPLLAHLLFWYFGAPELLPDAIKERLYAGNFEFVAAAIALTLYTAAFMAEDIRSGIRAIPAVQLEAGARWGSASCRRCAASCCRRRCASRCRR